MKRVSAAALALALLAGCGSTTDLRVRDHDVVVPSARVAIHTSPEVESPAVPHTGRAFELALSGTRGSARQELGPTEAAVTWGGRRFNGPVSLEHEFDFRFVEAAYRYRKFAGRAQAFGIEALIGLAYADLALTVSSPAQRASESVASPGILGGFGLLWKFRPTTSVQSRLAIFTSAEEAVSYVGRYDLYLAQALGRSTALRAGFASWQVRTETDQISLNSRSDARVRFSGLALGLDLMF